MHPDADGAPAAPRVDPSSARFEDAFRRWLLRALGDASGSGRAGVRALCFNVYPLGGGRHAVELIGAARCDPAAADWALEEVWLPAQPRVALPAAVADGEDALALVRRLLRDALDDRFAGVRLKRYPRIAAGGNDGLLDVLWERALA
jgi:hypothetical protein